MYVNVLSSRHFWSVILFLLCSVIPINHLFIYSVDMSHISLPLSTATGRSSSTSGLPNPNRPLDLTSLFVRHEDEWENIIVVKVLNIGLIFNPLFKVVSKPLKKGIMLLLQISQFYRVLKLKALIHYFISYLRTIVIK